MKKNEIDPKEVIHYYVDGGVKSQVGVAAIIRKGFGLKPHQEVRVYKSSRNKSTTDCEIRAVELAVEDAQKNGFDLRKVVIHSDQMALAKSKIKDKEARLYVFREKLKELGVTVVYTQSTHDLEAFDGVPEENIPKRVLNSLAVHKLVTSSFRKRNRYQNHVCKRNRKNKNKKAA